MKKNQVIDDVNSTKYSTQDDYTNDDQFEDGVEYEEVELIQVIDEFGNVTYEEVPYTGDFSEFEEVEYTDDISVEDGYEEVYEDEIYEDEIYEDELEDGELYDESIYEDRIGNRHVIYEDELTEEERLAYEAEGGIFYVDEDDDDLSYESYEEMEEEPVYKHLYHKNASFFGKLKRLFTEGKIVDVIIALTGIIVVIVGVYTFLTWNSAETVEEKMAEMSILGEQLAAVGTAGSDSILNVTNAYLTSISTVIDEEAVATAELVEVAVTFTSVEKDLKVKFENADTGELITGCTFEVTLTDSKSKTETLTDSDRDGIIYDESMAAGEYSVLIKDVGAYAFP
ncbi:MAG: hypothetical protein HGA25_07405, partial [Clostridiales bacterium]|nr:hypothetical protein [Clostridiales bacterium]